MLSIGIHVRRAIYFHCAIRKGTLLRESYDENGTTIRRGGSHQAISHTALQNVELYAVKWKEVFQPMEATFPGLSCKWTTQLVTFTQGQLQTLLVFLDVEVSHMGWNNSLLYVLTSVLILGGAMDALHVRVGRWEEEGMKGPEKQMLMRDGIQICSSQRISKWIASFVGWAGASGSGFSKWIRRAVGR